MHHGARPLKSGSLIRGYNYAVAGTLPIRLTANTTSDVQLRKVVYQR